jgi:D-lactate dehydrogenase
LVVATGMNTYFGHTAKLVEEAQTRSHFQKAVIKIGAYLIILALALVAVIFLVALYRHESLVETLQFALILTVAAIPAALPAVLSVGFDHIDLTACKARNIMVSNVPSYGDNTVAEYAFGLILALARKFKSTFDRIERGFFSRTGLIGIDIKGKTLGLIGTGRIGSHMARLGWAFGMKVIAYDVRLDVALKEEYGVQFMSLEDVLEQADVISLHVPYIPSTHHLINADRLRLLKPTALLINTSRGKLIDTKAVAVALREDRLGGVALDTFEGEDIWIEEEFLKHDDLPAIALREAMESFSIMHSERAILTPHNAFNTREALERILITSAGNIKAFFSDNPQNVVNIS